jgi:TusA-related sulfurtransferase
VRKLVLEELLSGEVLEVWIIDPAFAHAFIERGSKAEVTRLSQQLLDNLAGGVRGQRASLAGLQYWSRSTL